MMGMTMIIRTQPETSTACSLRVGEQIAPPLHAPVTPWHGGRFWPWDWGQKDSNGGDHGGHSQDADAQPEWLELWSPLLFWFSSDGCGHAHRHTIAERWEGRVRLEMSLLAVVMIALGTPPLPPPREA